jgi:hypothetical protein
MGQAMGREAAQLVVDQREELGCGVRITRRDSTEGRRDLIHQAISSESLGRLRPAACRAGLGGCLYQAT